MAVSQDIVVKMTHPMRILQASGTAPGFGPENLGPVLDPAYGRLLQHLEAQGARPGVCVAWYEGPREDGSVLAHAGFGIDEQPVTAGPGLEIVDLPSIEVAALVHHGAMDRVQASYGALMDWIEANGYRITGASRELYLEWHAEDLSKNVTELQMPISRG